MISFEISLFGYLGMFVTACEISLAPHILHALVSGVGVEKVALNHSRYIYPHLMRVPTLFWYAKHRALLNGIQDAQCSTLDAIISVLKFILSLCSCKE